MENNTLTCQGRDDLTQEEQHALDKLRISDYPKYAPKCFDAFIQHLTDKNLLVMTEKNLLQPQPNSQQKENVGAKFDALESEQPASSWTAPTPFNMTPKPKE